MLVLLESSAHNWFKNMSVKVQEWSEKFSRWLGLRKPVLFSSMKLMLSEELDLMVVQEATMRSKELCCKSSTKWMDSNQEETSKY